MPDQLSSPPAKGVELKVLTYNVHGCRGADGQANPARIAEVIANSKADIVALQEVDVNRPRSGLADQAEAIASHLDMMPHFHPSLHVSEEQYGNAILTFLPSKVVKTGTLPARGEPRGAIWVSIDVGPVELQLVNTHLSPRRRDRMEQLLTLLGPGWLGSDGWREQPGILAGDFNAVPSSLGYKMLTRQLRDAAAVLKRRPATFPARLPLLKLDHIFVSRDIMPLAAGVTSRGLARRASDHLPLEANLQIPAREARAVEPGQPLPLVDGGPT